MLLRAAYGLSLSFATVLIHAACTAAVLWWVRSLTHHHWALRSNRTRAIVLAGFVALMSLAAWLESALWAVFYWAMEVVPTFEEAHYFSLVTFTTLGYGDVTLAEGWRLLGAFQAANGILMFGWTTAIMVALSHKLFFADDLGPGRR